uniref:C2H2-type domain-containing protein n=1 Tax=viral metagenome TaxID=1070528 RepID=A0A6C0LKM2_9ZZZZ
MVEVYEKPKDKFFCTICGKEFNCSVLEHLMSHKNPHKKTLPLLYS